MGRPDAATNSDEFCASDDFSERAFIKQSGLTFKNTIGNVWGPCLCWGVKFIKTPRSSLHVIQTFTLLSLCGGTAVVHAAVIGRCSLLEKTSAQG